jgi:hypothetical protein
MMRPATTGASAGATVPDAARTTPSESATYQIDIVGHLDAHWATVLGGLTLTHLDGGTTRLTGQVVDQAHLHGILSRIRDLGVPLITLRRLDGIHSAGTDSAGTS